MATKKKTSSSSSMMPDWSFLPEELLHIVTKNVEDCFDIVHARSVCSSWRSTFPFPSYLLRPSYSLPTFSSFENEKEGLCTFEKVPVFLFRVLTPSVAVATSISEYFFGGIGRDESEDHMELPSPIQCSVKVKIPRSDPTLINMHDCQIFSLGYQYRLFGWQPKRYEGVAFLPLNKEGRRGEFVVLLTYANRLMVLTSAEMRWKRLESVREGICSELVAFKGKFYAIFIRHMSVIDAYSLEVIRLLPSRDPLRYLVPSDDDQLFMIEVKIPEFDILNYERYTCRVSRLDDEEAGKWVEVTDLEDRVLVFGNHDNVSCSVKSFLMVVV